MQFSDFYHYHFNKNDFISAIDNTIYEFDKLTLTKLKRLSKKALISELENISKQFSVEQKLEKKANDEFPNVYLPCEHVKDASAPTDRNHIIYCSGKKLIVNKDFKTMVSLLADDLRNPLKSKYMFSGMFVNNIISYFKFESRPQEIISVLKLN